MGTGKTGEVQQVEREGRTVPGNSGLQDGSQNGSAQSDQQDQLKEMVTLL